LVKGSGEVAAWTMRSGLGWAADPKAAFSCRRATLSAIGTLQAVDCHNDVWPLEDLNQPFEDPLVIVRPRFQVFFNDTMCVAHRLKRHLLVGHQRSLS
jgi:hypothetical protein